MKHSIDLQTLLIKLVRNEISGSELNLLLDYFDTNAVDDLHELIVAELNNVQPDDLAPVTAHERIIGDKVFAEIRKQIGGKSTGLSIFRFWSRIAAAAILIIAITVALFHFNSAEIVSEEAFVTGKFSKHSSAGGFGATLILANGKKITLSESANGELATEAGVRIVKEANGELVYEIVDGMREDHNVNKVNILSTANGQTYKVRLPDGSNVWLNAGSSLEFPVDLNHSQYRSVKLTGEGYFDIQKDRKRPFLVFTKDQKIEVLGTQFNVNGYTDEQRITTTLLEGSIKLNAGNLSKTLVPGEQAIKYQNSLQLRAANLQSVMDWRNGEFYLDHLNFKVALRKLERWYDIEFIYDKSISEDMLAGGWISRDSPLPRVLNLIGKSGQVKFRIEGRTVYVSK